MNNISIDLVRVFRLVVLLILLAFPVLSGADITVNVGYTNANAGTNVAIPISVSELSANIYSFEFELRYENTYLEPLSPCYEIAGTISESFVITANPHYSNNIIKIVGIGTEQLPQISGNLIYLYFNIKDNVPDGIFPLELLNFIFNTGTPSVLIINGGITVNIEQGIISPKNYMLKQNYPNPFNHSTSIVYDIHKESIVNIIIYDLMGKEVRTLINKYQSIGRHNVLWNGKDDLDQLVSGGIYFYKLQAGDFVQTRKMVLLK